MRREEKSPPFARMRHEEWGTQNSKRREPGWLARLFLCKRGVSFGDPVLACQFLQASTSLFNP